MTKSGVDKFLLSDAKELGHSIVDLNLKLNNLINSNKKNNIDGSVQETELKKELDEKRQEYTDLITGKKSEYYHKLAIFSLNPNFHKPFINMTVDEYVKDTYNEDYYSLSEADKQTRKAEYDKMRENTEQNFKVNMKNMFRSFLKMNENFSKTLKDYDKDGYASIRSGFYEALNDIGSGKLDYIKGLQRLNEVNKRLIDGGFLKIDLDTDTSISLGKFLVENGYIKEGLSEKEKYEISQKYLPLFKEKLGKEGLSEEEVDFEIQLDEETDKIRKKLALSNVDLNNLTFQDLYTLINDDTYFDGENTITLELSDNEKGILEYYLEPYYELNNIGVKMSELFNKAKLNSLAAPEDQLENPITPEEYISVGLNEASTVDDLIHSMKQNLEAVHIKNNSLVDT